MHTSPPRQRLALQLCQDPTVLVTLTRCEAAVIVDVPPGARSGQGSADDGAELLDRLQRQLELLRVRLVRQLPARLYVYPPAGAVDRAAEWLRGWCEGEGAATEVVDWPGGPERG